MLSQSCRPPERPLMTLVWASHGDFYGRSSEDLTSNPSQEGGARTRPLSPRAAGAGAWGGSGTA